MSTSTIQVHGNVDTDSNYTLYHVTNAKDKFVYTKPGHALKASSNFGMKVRPLSNSLSMIIK